LLHCSNYFGSQDATFRYLPVPEHHTQDLRGPEVALATPSVHLSCQTLEDSAELRQIPQ